MDLGDMLKAALEKADGPEAQENARATEATVLMHNSPERVRDAGQRYAVQHEFAPGQLVVWKPGLKNRRWPEYGVPAAVLEISRGQRHPSTQSGGTSYMEPLELRLGLFDPHNDFEGYWYDINRFEPYQDKNSHPSV